MEILTERMEIRLTKKQKKTALRLAKKEGANVSIGKIFRVALEEFSKKGRS